MAVNRTCTYHGSSTLIPGVVGPIGCLDPCKDFTCDGCDTHHVPDDGGFSDRVVMCIADPTGGDRARRIAAEVLGGGGGGGELASRPEELRASGAAAAVADEAFGGGGDGDEDAEELVSRRRIDEMFDLHDPSPVTPSSGVTLSKTLNGDEIAEVLQSEAAFTNSTAGRPIVATRGAATCIALGGYDPENKMAFVIHYSHAEEVRRSAEVILHNITMLVKKEIKEPIQLHLRGGIEGESEALAKAIEWLVTLRDDLPMQIVSADILVSWTMYSGGKSLFIDSRTGEVDEYDHMANPQHRDMSELDTVRAKVSVCAPHIRIAYSPNQPLGAHANFAPPLEFDCPSYFISMPSPKISEDMLQKLLDNLQLEILRDPSPVTPSKKLNNDEIAEV